jgi:hypothetical protein
VEECIAFISPMLQMGNIKKKTHGPLVIVEHVGIHYAQTSYFFKLLARIL